MSQSRNWHAWLNLMPPKPDDFHVIGQVLVPNPGVTPSILVREPQGFNPEILLLDLFLVQQAGIWPQVAVWATARLDFIVAPTQRPPRKVQVFENHAPVADIDVDHVGAPVAQAAGIVLVSFRFENSGNVSSVQAWVELEELHIENNESEKLLPTGSEFRLNWRFVGNPGSKLTIKYQPEGGAERIAVRDSEIPAEQAAFADYTFVQL